MKYFLLFVILIASCQNPGHDASSDAYQNDYSTLTEENAGERLKALRSSIKDSSFAIMSDANMAIQVAEFTLQRINSKPAPLTADSLAINETGKQLYRCMQRAYQLSLTHATRSSDISYYQAQLLIPEKEWLASQFGGKKTSEGLIALSKLQKDMLLVSMVVNKLDSDESRRQADEQYGTLETILKKSSDQSK